MTDWTAVDTSDKIDHAIRTALRERKAAYIEIACNIAAALCEAPRPISSVIDEDPSDPATLSAAVAAAAEFLRGKEKPVLLMGSKLCAAEAAKGGNRTRRSHGMFRRGHSRGQTLLSRRSSVVHRHLSCACSKL
jgi:TPP-dependent 2-oxoacid decarboxylase